MNKATFTGKQRSEEFGTRKFPVYEGAYDEVDGRIQLPDGRLVFVVIESTGEIGLYEEIVAMDQGDNIVRRFIAAERGHAGITAPIFPRGQLCCVGDKQVGWLRD